MNGAFEASASCRWQGPRSCGEAVVQKSVAGR
jgi:hypothetical protein